MLKFFKLLEKPLVTPSTNNVLLDLKGWLTKVFSFSAINMLNDEVSVQGVPKTAIFHPLNQSLINKGNV